jgi:hypothetical protein
VPVLPAIGNETPSKAGLPVPSVTTASMHCCAAFTVSGLQIASSNIVGSKFLTEGHCF